LELDFNMNGMINILKKWKRISPVKGLILFVLLFQVFTSVSQVSRSVYFLEQLPSSSLTNPAFHPDYKLYVNLPVVSTLYLGFESPFSFDQLTAEWETGDSLYIDRETVMGALNERNYFSFEIYNEFGRIGFGAGRHYFQLGISKMFSTKFAFEKELVELFLYGNGSQRFLGKRIHLNRVGLNMTSYHEFSLGYSYRLNEKLTFGTRLKYLNGAFNVWTEKADFQLYTSAEPNFPITVSSDILLRTSSTISDFDNMIDQIEGYKWFDISGNHGYGFDLGLEFRPEENLRINASVVDFGWINWKDNVKNFVSANPGEDFTFEGFDINDFISNGSFTDSIQFLDTIIDHFRLETTYDSYTSHLNPKVYLGGMWSMTKNNEVGVMLRSDIAESRVQPSITFNYLHRFGRVLTVYGNYSIMANNYANIGLGFITKLGPVQFYILNDMAWALVKPAEARNYNFQFGVNFVFGRSKKDGEVQGIRKN